MRSCPNRVRKKSIPTRGLLAMLASGLCPAFPAAAADMAAIDPQLRNRAVQETAIPIRPGVPGEQPFWNVQAVQFLYAPAFDFEEIPGARSYRFTIAPVEGPPLSFTAGKPWAPLSPIWTGVPPGRAVLTVAGCDEKGVVIGEPRTRTFHRAEAFGTAYPAPAMDWRESARAALDALVHSQDLRCWFTTGEPDPRVDLYRYPSKIVGAAAAALAVYAARTPRPADADEALRAARRAADYLLGISQPGDAAWAFHPPTYHPAMYRDRLKGHMAPGRYMTQCGAETGLFYLDVHAATGDAKYLDAAVRIAETYARQQRPDGSWLLFVTAQDGRAVTDNVLIPTLVVEFLDRLGHVTGGGRFDRTRERAIGWIENNPVRTWNWQGQFEDVNPQPPYQNLTKHDACAYAIHLFRTSPRDQSRRALALDLLRFSEDQFVVWAQPPADSPAKQSPDGAANARPKGWLLPCVLEQYRCYAPVCASSAKLMRTYLAAHAATGDPLHLEKARALAATLVRTQSNRHAPGRYLTWVKQPSGPMWFNCELAAIRAMDELAACEDPNPEAVR